MPVVNRTAKKASRRLWAVGAVLALLVTSLTFFLVTLVRPLDVEGENWSVFCGLDRDPAVVNPSGFSSYGPIGLTSDTWGWVYRGGRWEYRIEYSKAK